MVNALGNSANPQNDLTITPKELNLIDKAYKNRFALKELSAETVYEMAQGIELMKKKKNLLNTDLYASECIYKLCDTFSRDVAWCVLTPKSVKAMFDFSCRIIGQPDFLDIGGGRGYSAWALNKAGAHVRSIDCINEVWPSHQNYFYLVEVLKNGRAVLSEVALATNNALNPIHKPSPILLLSFPPPDSDMAYDTLKAYNGDGVIVIGPEEQIGNHAFFHLLQKDWIKEKVPFDTYPMYSCSENSAEMRFYRRKARLACDRSKETAIAQLKDGLEYFKETYDSNIPRDFSIIEDFISTIEKKFKIDEIFQLGEFLKKLIDFSKKDKYLEIAISESIKHLSNLANENDSEYLQQAMQIIFTENNPIDALLKIEKNVFYESLPIRNYNPLTEYLEENNPIRANPIEQKE